MSARDDAPILLAFSRPHSAYQEVGSTMHLSGSRRTLVALPLLTACPLDVGELPPLCDPQAGACPSGASSTDASTSSVDPTEGLHTVTDALTTETSEDPTTTSSDPSTSTGEGEAVPPKIAELILTPDSLMSAGVVQVTAEVERPGAETVAITVDEGAPALLLPAAMDGTIFVGQITVFGESWKGAHEVAARATHGGVVSLPAFASFTVNAPKAGTEAWLEKSGLVPSYGAALAVGGDGEVLELITRPTPKGQECHLRRRAVDGASVWPEDTRWIAPLADCVSEGVKLAPDGTIYALVNTYTDAIGRWELHHLDADGQLLGPVVKVDLADHIGRGLDVSPAGDVLLCGTKPAAMGLDAWARLIPAAGVPWTTSWDYLDPKEPKPNKFHELTQDCAFVGDRLVVVGEARGPHELNNIDFQTRGFALEFDASAELLAARVSSSALGWHSGFLALGARNADSYVTAGYRCAAMVTPCSGALTWLDLGAITTAQQSVTAASRLTDVAWSPAGYAVVAGQRVTLDAGFLVQAWPSVGVEPIFDYGPDKTKFQVANSVALDPVGFIHAGGHFVEFDDTLVAGVAKLHPY